MFTYFLALVLFAAPAEEPQIIEGYKDSNISTAKEQCEIEADKQNRNNVIVRDPKLRSMGVEFVCFKVERLYV